MVNRTPLHLRQSDLDGACGTHCTLMALMLLGVIKRDELDALPKGRSKALAKLWKQSRGTYFDGTSPKELQSLISAFNPVVTTNFIKKRDFAPLMKCINNDGVCILGIANADYSHWVMVVGYASKTDDADANASTLLILDPNVPTVPLSPWNALLSINASGKSKPVRHRYEQVAGTDKVEIDSVLAITLTKTFEEMDVDVQ